MNEMTPEARPQIGTFFVTPHGEKENWPQIALATERFRAIDLSCRAVDACGAGCWVLGLDSRWGCPLRSVFHTQPPIEFMKTLSGIGALDIFSPCSQGNHYKTLLK